MMSMDIDDYSSQSVTNTSIYDDTDMECSVDEIHENNWQYEFQSICQNSPEKKLDVAARLLPFDGSCEIHFKYCLEKPYRCPLSPVICSRIICDYSSPLPVSNKHDFCGAKISNTAWQIDQSQIALPRKLTDAVRSSALQQLNIENPKISAHFDIYLNKLAIFGPCTHSKIYFFDDKLFFYLATILVFLPSTFQGGTYRYTDDDGDDDDETEVYRHRFNHNQTDPTRPFILVLPPDSRHEIEPIENGYQLILVYHLVSKSTSIDKLYRSLSQPEIQISFNMRKLNDILLYWQNNLDRMPIKLIIPLQSPYDYSPYFSILFREKYRHILQAIRISLKSTTHFLLFSATLHQEKNKNNEHDLRLFVRQLRLLDSTYHGLILKFDEEHERTVLFNEFLGDLHLYLGAFNDVHRYSTDSNLVRSNCQFQVLILLPHVNQWDFLLENHSSAQHHLLFMNSSPKMSSFLYEFCRCFLRDRTSTDSSFVPLIQCFICLPYSEKLVLLIKEFLKFKRLKEEFFVQPDLTNSFLNFLERYENCSILTLEFYHFFRQLMNQSIPIKIKDYTRLLLNIKSISFRAVLIYKLIRYILKPRTLLRHISLSVLCSLLHLLTLDGSYSNEVELTLAYQILKRVRKFSADTEIVSKGLKLHLIPTLIEIQRDLNKIGQRRNSVSPAFILIYQYCRNALDYYCSPSLVLTSPLLVSSNAISINEALLICSCKGCTQVQSFLLDARISTLMIDLTSNDLKISCLRYTLKQFPILSVEYKYDPFTGQEQTAVLTKSAHEQEHKQLCFHLRRLLMQLPNL